jgi:hypothetical protein
MAVRFAHTEDIVLPNEVDVTSAVGDCIVGRSALAEGTDRQTSQQGASQHERSAPMRPPAGHLRFRLALIPLGS